jgi:hypothetical protein
MRSRVSGAVPLLSVCAFVACAGRTLLYFTLLYFSFSRIYVKSYGTYDVNTSGVQVILRCCMKLTRQLLVYADDVSILGESLHAINKTAEVLVVVSMYTDWTRSKY